MITFNETVLVSTREAAEMLGITPGHFRNMKSDGKLGELDGVPIGGAVFYSLAAVQRLVVERAR